MNKNKFLLFTTLMFIMFLSVSSLSVTASYSEDADSIKTDKFIPSSGVKVKESPLARMMENATKNAMNSSKDDESSVSNSSKNSRNNEEKQNYNSGGRSYKWF